MDLTYRPHAPAVDQKLFYQLTVRLVINVDRICLCCWASFTSGVEKTIFESGSITKEIFQQFINELSASLEQDERVLFVLDNARCHSNITTSNPYHILNYLPPYSPQLNPIELCFSFWKAAVKSRLNDQDTQARFKNHQLAVEANSNLSQWRAQILQELGQSCLSVVTAQKVMQCYQHISSISVQSAGGGNF